MLIGTYDGEILRLGLGILRLEGVQTCTATRVLESFLRVILRLSVSVLALVRFADLLDGTVVLHLSVSLLRGLLFRGLLGRLLLSRIGSRLLLGSHILTSFTRSLGLRVGVGVFGRLESLFNRLLLSSVLAPLLGRRRLRVVGFAFVVFGLLGSSWGAGLLLSQTGR